MKKKCVNIFFILFLVVFVGNVRAQVNLNELNPEEYLDFWIGKWNISWEDESLENGMATGTNRIMKTLNGNVVEENFSASDGKYQGLIGRSYSVYKPSTGKWYQTWIDNNGGYLDFVGEFIDNKRIFKRETVNHRGEKIMQRMVFHDIKSNSFIWDWELSEDEGKTWQLKWRIFYNRAKH